MGNYCKLERKNKVIFSELICKKVFFFNNVYNWNIFTIFLKICDFSALKMKKIAFSRKMIVNIIVQMNAKHIFLLFFALIMLSLQ